MSDYQKRVASIAKQAARTAKPSDPIADLLLGSDYIIYYPVIAHMLGSVTAAVLLCKAWSWARTQNANERAGWFYWSQSDISRQTGMGRRVTDTAKNLLTAKGLLVVEVRGMPAVSWWRLDKEAFFAQMRLFMDSSEEYTEE